MEGQRRSVWGRVAGVASAVAMLATMGVAATTAGAAENSACTTDGGMTTCTLDNINEDLTLNGTGSYTLKGTLNNHSVVAGSQLTSLTLDGATINGAAGKPALDLSVTGNVSLNLGDREGTLDDTKPVNVLNSKDGQPGIKLGSSGTLDVSSPTKTYDYGKLKDQANKNAIKMLTVNGGTNADGIESDGATLKMISGALSANGKANGDGVTAKVEAEGGFLDTNGAGTGSGINGDVHVTKTGTVSVSSSAEGVGIRGDVTASDMTNVSGLNIAVNVAPTYNRISSGTKGVYSGVGIEGDVQLNNRGGQFRQIYVTGIGTAIKGNVNAVGKGTIDAFAGQYNPSAGGSGAAENGIDADTVTADGADISVRGGDTEDSNGIKAQTVSVDNDSMLVAETEDSSGSGYGINASSLVMKGNSQVIVDSTNAEDYKKDPGTQALFVTRTEQHETEPHYVKDDITVYGTVTNSGQEILRNSIDGVDVRTRISLAPNATLTLESELAVSENTILTIASGSTIEITATTEVDNYQGIAGKLVVEKDAKIINHGTLIVAKGGSIEDENRIENIEGGKIVHKGDNASVGEPDEPEVTVPEGDDSGLETTLDGVKSEDLSSNKALTDLAGTFSSDEASAALKKANITVPEGITPKVVVKPYFDIKVNNKDSYNPDNGVLALDIKVRTKVYATTNPDGMVTNGNVKNTVELESDEHNGKELEVTGPVTVSVPLPKAIFDKVQDNVIYVRHDKTKEGGGVHLHKATVDKEGVATFTTTDGFSPFTFDVNAKPVAKIGDTEYGSLKEAVDAAKDNDTINLLSDITLTAPVTISKKVTIDGSKPGTEGKGADNQYKINGQLVLNADSIKVQNVHFVLDSTTDWNAGNWANNIRILSGSSIHIVNNSFTITADAKTNAYRAEGVAIFPADAKNVHGTVIKDNIFYLASNTTLSEGRATSNFGIFIDNEINEAKDKDGKVTEVGSITNTTIENNTLLGVNGESGVVTDYFLGVYGKYDADALKQFNSNGLETLNIKNNHLQASTSDKVMVFYGAAKMVNILSNEFGKAPDYNIGFYPTNYFGAAKSTPSTSVTLKGNAFQGAVAVKDFAVNGSSGLDKDAFLLDKDNKFDPTTIPYQGAAVSNGNVATYGVMFYDGKKLLGWQVVKATSEVKLPEITGYKASWYTDAELKTPYNAENAKPTDGVLKLYAKKTSTGGNGGGSVSPTPSPSEPEVVTPPASTDVPFGGSLDLSGLRVDFHDGAGRVGADVVTVSGLDASRPGVQTVTLASRKDPSKTVTIDVLVGFRDVDSSTAHHGEIRTLLEKGVTRGFADGTFRGMNSLNRQDLAAFLYRMAGQPEYEPSKADFVFQDVTTATPHYREILWAAKHGVVTGFTAADGTRTYGGEKNILRQDLVAMLYRLAGSPEANGSSFADVTEATPHAEAIAWAKRAGVTTGFADDTFRGGQTIVRQDAAAFLGRVIDKNLIKF